jgi:predicted nucleic acid-binding protein
VVADQYKKPYFDANVFLAWIKKEEVNGIKRWERVGHILALAEKGQFHIFTSTLTLAEVYKLRSGTVLPQKENGELLAYFEHEYIELVDVDRTIGEQANAFCRQYNIYPNDAIHLACALRAKCDVLLAYDGRFQNIIHPQIKIDEPEIIGQTFLPTTPQE